ncbi:MAG: alanine racemase [Candidatus Cloacimonadales bacterium]
MEATWIELDQKALKQNIRYLQKRLGAKCKFCSVIKGNAYGHGIEQFVPMAEECGIDYFAVFDVYEAQAAAKVKKASSELMIMGMIMPQEMEWVITQQVSFFVFNLERLHLALQTARKLQLKARIHLELETGLNRTGFEEQELPQVIELLKANRRYFSLEGVCTHYAGAESVANYLRIQAQIKKFKELNRNLRREGIKAKYRHTACSAAALNYPETRMDMVRLGIAQYGYWPNNETKMYNLLSHETKFTRNPLRQVISWKSRIMSIKEVAAGKFVSYGDSYLTDKATRIATIPVGYFHGYRRSLSNLGTVLIAGREVRIIGSINMNMMIANLNGMNKVEIGDEVVLVGSQKRKKITIASFSDRSNLVNYELLTRIPAQLKRLVINPK